MRVTVTSLTAPEAIEVGTTGTVDVQVDIVCSHKNSNYATFSITVSLSQQNAKLTLPAAQSLGGQVPGGTSAPYTWSKTFSFTVTGKAEGSEVITASARMDPNHEAPAVTDSSNVPTTVTISEHPPVLSLPSIEPTTGDTTTDFAYKVKYSDADGDAPSFVNLVVDGSFRSGLKPVPGQGSDHKEGVVYVLSGVNLAQGSHTYGFISSDGTTQVELPASGYLEGPDVVRSNLAPVLSNGTVSPASGGPGDRFTFTVDYSDPDGDPPSTNVKISISGGPFTEMTIDPTAPASKRDGLFTNGERYIIELALEEGDHEFVLNASDGTFFTESGPYGGPIVSTAPVLVGSIDAPEDGTQYLAGEPIWFNGTFTTNKASTDIVFDWRSNISGQIGTGLSVRTAMLEGRHEVTFNVSSASLGLWSESKVGIEVLSEVPVITIISYSPASSVVMDETEEVHFKVRASISSSGQMTYEWRLDGERVAGTVPDFRYITDHSSAGYHLLECLMSAGPALPAKVVWTITVLELPAPIVYIGEDTIDLGVFEQGDMLEFSLNVSDPLGRPFSVIWSVDGVKMEGMSGTDTTLALQDGEWSVPGNHMIEALVQNPDGVELDLFFLYYITGPDHLGIGGLGPPDPLLPEGVDAPRPGKTGLGPVGENWPGYLMIIVCTIIAGIRSMTAFIGLVRSDPSKRPVKARGVPIVLESRVDEEGFEIWG